MAVTEPNSNADSMKTKLNVGCGTDVKVGFVNIDIVPLPGVDIVHDLQSLPWPFENNLFDEIHLIHVLEHLTDTVGTLEELHRISAPDAKVTIRVPYWNSPDMIADPTHKRQFSERTMAFFDPAKSECINRPYYSTARFQIARLSAYIKCFIYIRVTSRPLTTILFFFARYLGGIVWVVEFELVCRKGVEY